MLMESKPKRKPASSAINGGGRIIHGGIEVVKNTESLNHWDFLDEIEAPMWADLSLCDLTNDETDDLWFDTCHEFHQCSSRKLISTFFHPTNSIFKQEPLSPKIPSSVSKSRGKSYKIRKWEQKKVNPTCNKQHPVKTLTRKSYASTASSNKVKPISTNKNIKEKEVPKTRSSCESGLTDNSREKTSKSNSCSLRKQDQEHESSCKSTLTSNHGQTSSQTSKSSVGGSHLEQGKKTVIEDTRNKLKTLSGASVKEITKPRKNKEKVENLIKPAALNSRILCNRNGNNTVASKATTKGKVGKVLMPRKVNEENEIINKENKKVGSLISIKETSASATMVKKSVAQSIQKNGSKKLIDPKEKSNNRKRDKDTAQKVYFR